MKIQAVRDALKEISRWAEDDDARAHKLEDSLHQDVLRAISCGEAEDPVEMARIALLSNTIVFSRWYE